MHLMKVLLDPFLNRGVATAKTVYLCQSGDATLHIVPSHISWNFLSEFLDEKGEFAAPASIRRSFQYAFSWKKLRKMVSSIICKSNVILQFRR